MSESISEADLLAIEQRAAKATGGPWHPHFTDDEEFSSAAYVSTEMGKIGHDNKRRLFAGGKDQANPAKVVAITLLQTPYLAITDECSANTQFIAKARTDIPRLVLEVRNRIFGKKSKSLRINCSTNHNGITRTWGPI